LGEQLNGLLRLRVSPPAVPPGFVDRRRLAERLTAAAGHPVTLISAGPGYGKTLTAAAWSRSGAAPGRPAWLSLDETDNDLQAFWSDLLGALVNAGAVPAGSVLSEIRPAAGFGDPELQQIRVGLAELPSVVTLVLDDFHLITNQRVLESFGQLLTHQPPQVRLVLTTRSDPALRLHRMRVSGDLYDLRADDLAFTPPEAAELLRRNAIEPSPVQLEVLLRRTEGWAAGLRLAVLGLDSAEMGESIEHFTGTDRLVAEYLIEELLDRLPAADREFLLTTSVTERVSVALANELTGRDDGQQVLDRLVAQNALLIGLAGRTEWLRFHPMLRDLLVTRLAQEQPGSLSDLHLRASRWFAAQGEPIPAIRHASAARCWDEVGRLLTEVAWPLILTASGPALVSALGSAAALALVDPSPSTLLAAALCHFHTHDFDAMLRDGDHANDLLTDIPDNERRPAAALIGMIRVVHSRFHHPARTAPAAAELLGVLDAPGRHLPTTHHHRVITVNNLAIGQLWTGELDQAESTLATVRTKSRELGLGLTEIGAIGHLSLLDVIHGRLGDAAPRIAAVHQTAHRRGWLSEPIALILTLSRGLIHLERGELDQAATTIDAGLAISRHGSDVACRVALGIADIAVAVTRRDPVAAVAASTMLANIQAKTGDLPPMLARWCALAHTDARLTAGDPDPAMGIDTRNPPDSYPSALERIVQAKALLTLNRPGVTLDLLAPIPTTSGDYPGVLIEAGILSAIASDQLNRATAALTAMTLAIDLAHDLGITRPFIAAGPQINPILNRHRHLVARHLDFTRTLTTPDENDPAHFKSTANGAVAPPMEPLTERELAVLSYLPTMLKTAEIATDLFVSGNTVKTHQQAIYRKLGVKTRRDAVEKARAVKLL
jgi:LuxR family maltose regulon positive regulatory protein